MKFALYTISNQSLMMGHYVMSTSQLIWDIQPTHFCVCYSTVYTNYLPVIFLIQFNGRYNILFNSKYTIVRFLESAIKSFDAYDFDHFHIKMTSCDAYTHEKHHHITSFQAMWIKKKTLRCCTRHHYRHSVKQLTITEEKK